MRLVTNTRTWNFFGLLLFAGMVLAIFWEVLPWFMAPLAPDAMPFFSFGNRTLTLENLLATGGEFTPHHFYWLIFHPLLANKLGYIVDTLLMALAVAYYLRIRGAGYPAAWVGGLAMGFCGYGFTLLSAGHRGHFDLFACALFAFGLLVLCFRNGSWFHFAMLGACIAWGVPTQPDLFVFLMLLIGAYALWLTFARRVDPTTPPVQRIVRVWPRFLLTGVVGLGIAWSGIHTVLTQTIAGRKDQIASGTSDMKSGVNTPESVAAKKREQWIFATNWSLPPEDVAEFIVPGVFGNDSFQPPYPYWGRLGRPYGWAPGQRNMPNYRQHTVYLGALSVCFALFAGFIWWRTRRSSGERVATVQDATGGGGACGPALAVQGKESGGSGGPALPERGKESGGSGGPALPARDDLLVDVPFWLGAGGACVLLSMGRYTPAYHLIYAVPYLDLIRCPVKFHHLVEICTAMLCGLGVESWWRGAVVAMPAKQKAVVAFPPESLVCRWMAVLAAIIMGVLLIAAGVVESSSQAIVAHIDSLGLRGYGPALAGYTAENLVRAAFVFGAAAMLFWLGRPRLGRNQPAVWLLALLALVLALDLATVARRYIRPINLQPFYASHAVSDAVLSRGGIGAGVANYVTTRSQFGDWFTESIRRQGLCIALDAAPGSTEAAVMQALASRPDVLWRTLHVRFVIAPWKAAAAFVKRQMLEPLVSFSLGEGVVRQAQPSMEANVLAAFGDTLPVAYVVDGWQGGLNVEAQVQRMRDPVWDPAKMTVCDANGATGSESRVIGQVQVVKRRGYDFRLTTTLRVEAAQAGLAVLDEKYADNLVVCVDGRIVPVQRANALWAAVEVPAGHHEVTVRRRSHAGPVLFSAGVGLCVCVWGLWRLLTTWVTRLRRRSL